MMLEHTICSLDGPTGGVRVTCDSGAAWITQAGDCKDYILSAGMNFTACGKGSVVIQLMEDARVTVRRPDTRPALLRFLLSNPRFAQAADSWFRRKLGFPTLRRCGRSAHGDLKYFQGGGRF